MLRLTVLSRSYCHLCEDLVAALEQFRGRCPSAMEVAVVDIDAHPALEARWGDKVPVLLDGETEICHYFFDADALSAHLAGVSPAQTGGE
ncbi:MAG: glutaredoxin family protein [Betaproteobacteria bacterium]|nr:glutaredoxin family protein [Betaproteobacteria bacterium]